MASLIEAIDIKRKSFFEFEDAPYHCIDVDISKPTARGGQTLVRIKMRNLLTQAVFDKTFKAGEKFKEPDLEMVPASFLYTDADGYQTVRHYDLRRQLDEETRAGETTVYTYYDAGQRKTLQRPNGAPWTWHYGYDSAGRLHTVTSPEGHETTFGYDAADNRDSITDARQHETTFAYDGRNRLSGKTYPGGKLKYDPDVNVYRGSLIYRF